MINLSLYKYTFVSNLVIDMHGDFYMAGILSAISSLLIVFEVVSRDFYFANRAFLYLLNNVGVSRLSSSYFCYPQPVINTLRMKDMIAEAYHPAFALISKLLKTDSAAI